jgi:hypothetical protein
MGGEQREGAELRGQGTEREDPQHAIVTLVALEVERGERRERRLDVEPGGHLGAPEEKRDREPDRR